EISRDGRLLETAICLISHARGRRRGQRSGRNGFHRAEEGQHHLFRVGEYERRRSVPLRRNDYYEFLSPRAHLVRRRWQRARWVDDSERDAHPSHVEDKRRRTAGDGPPSAMSVALG